MDLVRATLGVCQSSYLSLGGWVVLIHSMLSAILVYQMSANIMPERIKRKLHRMSNNFL